MMPPTDTDYKKLFTELIKKQIVVLGPDITMARVKSVGGIEMDANGQVTNIIGDPQAVLQNLINQFVELSGLIVKKTMESILSNYSGMAAFASSNGLNVSAAQAPTSVAPQASPVEAHVPNSAPVPSGAPNPPSPVQEAPSPAPDPVSSPQSAAYVAPNPSENNSTQTNSSADPQIDQQLNDLNKMIGEMNKGTNS